MKIMSKALRVAFAAAALCAASSVAHAKPRSVVILDFEGARKLADSGHNAVISVLGEQYDIVNTKRWEKAYADAGRNKHGPAAWGQAARASGVDCVIEGWVQDEGRKHTLTLVVREASTGNEVDQVSIKLGDQGITADGTKQLATSLDEVLEYVSIDASDNGRFRLPPATTPRKMIGARAGKTEDRVKAVDDDEPAAAPRSHKRDDDASPADEPRHRTRRDDDDDRPRRTRRDDDDDRSRRTRRDDSSSVDDRRDTRVADVTPIIDDKRVIVAAATPPADDKVTRDELVDLFPTPSRERDIILDKQAPHKPVPTPRFEISGGGYLYSRQLEFTASDQTGPQEYVGTQVQGIAVKAAAYPWPLQKTDGRMSGIGFSVMFGKAVGSYYTFDDGTATADYTIDQSIMEAKIHYRYPIDGFTLEGHVGYGRSTHLILDAPQELEVPDVSYEWLSIGGEVELAVTDRATVAVGGQYMKLLDTGDLSSEDWYGSGSASGLEVHGSFTVPLPARLFVKGTLSYRRISTSFNGDGVLTQMWGVVDATDTNVGAAVDVGIQF